jgi:hypothetical protein
MHTSAEAIERCNPVADGLQRSRGDALEGAGAVALNFEETAYTNAELVEFSRSNFGPSAVPKLPNLGQPLRPSRDTIEGGAGVLG